MATFRTALIGAAWVAVRIASRQLANVAVFFWLAFELAPAELGVASLGVTPALFTIPLVTRGIREAVIQRETPDDRFLTTALATNVLLGLGLSLMLLALAPAMGPVFGDDRLPMLGAVAAAIPLLAALGSLHETLWEREFRYRTITLIYMGGALAASAAAIAVAYAGQAVWALVVFNLVTYATVSLLMWLVRGWPHRARPDPREARAILRFAAPVMLSQLIATGNLRIVEMITGALLSPAAAAFLRFGSNFSRLLNQIFVTPVVQVLMPAFARSKTDAETNLFRVLAVNAAVLLFVFSLAAALVPKFIAAVFGPEWDEAGAVAAALCFGVYAALIGPVGYPLLVVRGKGDWTVALTLAGLVFTVGFVAAGTTFGAVGAAAGFALRALATIPMSLWVLRRALGVAPRRMMLAFVPYAVAATVMYAALVWGVAPLTADWPVLPDLLVQGVAGTLVYIGLLRVGVRRLAPEPYGVLRSVLPGPLARLL